MILTFSQVACDLGLFEKLAESTAPLSSISLGSSSGADPILLSNYYLRDLNMRRFQTLT